MNRIELTFNGKMIMGITCTYERPNNSVELRKILQELIVMSDSMEEKTPDTIVDIEPIERPFVQYAGGDGYEPYGPKAKDKNGIEYCACLHGLFANRLFFRMTDTEYWQHGRPLTDADRLAFSHILF